MREIIYDLEMNAKNWNTRELYQGIRRERKGFQARTNIIRNGNGDMIADSRSILDRWKNYFDQLLNVHVEQDIEDEVLQTAEILVTEPSVLEIEMAIDKLNR